jgi:uncharacterized protein (UPF0179 family)
MGTDCTGSCKSNYHAITSTTAPIVRSVDSRKERMGGVMVNELACSEIVGSSHDLVKPKTIKYQDNVLLGIRTMCPQ